MQKIVGLNPGCLLLFINCVDVSQNLKCTATVCLIEENYGHFFNFKNVVSAVAEVGTIFSMAPLKLGA
jgi:hypothetical protein